ncbi:unnamed protein product [Symbiodinium sp. CCMP2456]|nr:unnamed protein product [Symbiodinium sp. CCMP2456]
MPRLGDVAAALLSTFALLLGGLLSICTFLYGTGDRVDRFRYGKHSNCLVRVAFLFFVLGVVALAALTTHHSLAGFWWTALIVWPLTCCCNTCWIYGAKVEAEEGCYLTTEEREMQDKEQQQARQEVLQRTIVFEGSVLEWVGRPCVCSWPGKYEGAWDSLVSSSRNGDVSAAVVFLPDGTADFGHHAEIPDAEGIVGECWCVPLYGEQKPWGCRWWSHWIANIEEAVKKNAELEVYYFVDHVGRGKAQSFSTAGEEYVRRETLNRRLDGFKETQQFKASGAPRSAGGTALPPTAASSIGFFSPGCQKKTGNFWKLLKVWGTPKRPRWRGLSARATVTQKETSRHGCPRMNRRFLSKRWCQHLHCKANSRGLQVM